MWKKKIWDFKIKLQILLSNLRLNSGVWTVLLHFFLFCKYFTKNCNKSLFIISVKIWSLCEMFVYYTTSVPAPDVAASFQYPFTHFSSISVLTITQPQTHQNSNKQRPTQSDSGLKAFYCSSRLLYVQKRWPAKTFLVGGDTEPQIDCCFLDTNFFFFFFTVQSITTTKYMLLPLQKGLGKCGKVRVKTNASLIYLHFFFFYV